MSSSRIAKIKEIKLVYVDNDEPRKEVDYIASLEPLKSCKELVGLHVPVESDFPSDYNLEELIPFYYRKEELQPLRLFHNFIIPEDPYFSLNISYSILAFNKTDPSSSFLLFNSS